MNILYVLNNIMDFTSGCHFYRYQQPSRELIKLGHQCIEITCNNPLEDKIEWADVVVFSRAYSNDYEGFYKLVKKKGKPVVYDLDDDVWQVVKENPAATAKQGIVGCANFFIKKADAITVSTETLANVIRKKTKKPVFLCHNGMNQDLFKRGLQNQLPVVMYSGSSSHYADLLTILPEIVRLSHETDFAFVLQGVVQAPIESSMFKYQKLVSWGIKHTDTTYHEEALKVWNLLKQLKYFQHIGFYLPELHPKVVSSIAPDISICPLQDIEFNRSKSCIKFYEAALSGATTLAPNLMPYKAEVDLTYTTPQEFYEGLKKLVNDESFRRKILKEQLKFVVDNRLIKNTITEWINAYEYAINKNGK